MASIPNEVSQPQSPAAFHKSSKKDSTQDLPPTVSAMLWRAIAWFAGLGHETPMQFPAEGHPVSKLMPVLPGQRASTRAS